jgi:HAD superfamily hydrolase (TIGR01509 family)
VSLQALLFDLDGTLVHTDPLHFVAWRAMLSAHGVEIDEAGYARQVSGRHNPEIVADLLPHLNAEARRRVAADKEARFRRVAEAALAPLPGVREVLTRARAAGVATAVVTNAPRENAEFMLRALGLRAAIDALGIGDEAAAPKPDPAPYAEMLQRLGVEAADALAFEDSTSGIASARGAGLAVVGLTTTRSAATLRAHGAFLAVPDFDDAALRSGPLAELAGWGDPADGGASRLA